ncbi:hypothetical protein [Streptomyces sp. NPDC126933]|uniref:hypothetical protein n=1 Tax=unclassified Streptomyces TaxID=2593676 RepID=UPI003667F473
MRFTPATLLALGVYAMTAAPERAHRRDQTVPARSGCPYDPFAGHFRTVLASGPALTEAGFARPYALSPRASGALCRDGGPEREQRRATSSKTAGRTTRCPRKGNRPARPARAPPGTALVVSHGNYQGSGYSPGAALLAAHLSHRKKLERQFATEGGC